MQTRLTQPSQGVLNSFIAALPVVLVRINQVHEERGNAQGEYESRKRRSQHVAIILLGPAFN